MKKLIPLLLLLPLLSHAQVTNPTIVPVSSAPSGSCTQTLPIELLTPNGTLYTCQSGTWAAISGGGGGATLPYPGIVYATSATGGNVVTPLEFGQASSDASGNLTLDSLRTSAINASDVSQSVLVGDDAGRELGVSATGANVGPNTMVGYEAGYSTQFGVDNVFVGSSAGFSFNGPENSDPADGNNTCIGEASCYGDKTMDETIALGQKAYLDGNANAAGGSSDNIFIGIHSDNWDGGSDNILEGYAITRYTGSSSALVTGTGNVLLGAGILSCPSCGSISSPITNNYDTYIGFDAGLEAFNSSYGIGIGYDALSSFTGGSSTASAIAVGHGALQGLTTGVSDTAVGDYAANAATTADYISAFGFQACTTDTTANSCTAFGYASGKVTTVAITAFGYESGYSNTSGTNNDIFGSAGGYGITTGIRNVSIGDNSMDHGGAANEDVMVGYDAGYYESSSSNVYIGYTAGGTSSTNTTAGNNVAIGATAFNSSTSSNEYDVAVGSNSTCAGCTSSEMLGYEADVGAVAGAAQIGTGTNSTADTMQFQTLPIASLATFSVSGCGTAGSLTGSGLAGTFTAGATSCAPVITTGVTAPHGFVCDAHDWTTPADTLAQASATTTTATFGTATVVSGDTIAFKCSAY